MPTIKPIETHYNGLRFRSRLEARWAVFFDALGIEYEYEPEGFELPSGARYLPDFRVKCYGTRGGAWSHDAVEYGRGQITPFDLWVEVKGNMTRRDAEKINEFAGLATVSIPEKNIEITLPHNPILILGNIPNGFDTSDWAFGIDEYPDIAPKYSMLLVDGEWGVAFPGAINGKLILLNTLDLLSVTDVVDTVEMAADKARKARFEYSERG